MNFGFDLRDAAHPKGRSFMKSVLALVLALAFSAPLAAHAAEADRRQERAFQNSDRGAQRAERRAQMGERRAQRQQPSQARPAPQRQGAADSGRWNRQQNAAPPQRQRPPRADPRRDNGNAVAQRPDRQAGRGPGNNQREGWNGRNGRPAANRPDANGPRGNRNPDWNGRGNRWDGQQDDGRYAGRGPGRDRDRWNGNRRGYDNRWDNDRRYAGRYDGRRDNGRRYWHRGRFSPSIRVSPFYYPRGYSYYRWSIGARLPALFLSVQYYFNDYYSYGIAPPPPGYRWVRYGTDLLLVNIYSAEVVDVVYDVFYW